METGLKTILMKNHLKNLLLFCFLILCQGLVYAGPGTPTGETDEPPVPIDDYLPLLLTAGLALGVYWIYKNSKKRKMKTKRSQY